LECSSVVDLELAEDLIDSQPWEYWAINLDIANWKKYIQPGSSTSHR
jgi:hypothetical protein